MLKEKLLPISIFFFSISIIISATIIADGIRENGGNVNVGLSGVTSGLHNIASTVSNVNNNSVVYSRGTYDIHIAASYLGITEYRLLEIIGDKKSNIPYIKIGLDYVFSKAALDKWLEKTRLEIQ